MARWQESFARFFSWPDVWSRPRVLLLLIGLGVLFLLLLVLRTTRWGQAKTLSKCVVLSVFAHVLLLVYACGVELFFGAPPKPHERILHLTLISPEEDSERNPSSGVPAEDGAEESGAPSSDPAGRDPTVGNSVAAPPAAPVKAPAAVPLPDQFPATSARSPTVPPAPELLPSPDRPPPTSRPAEPPAAATTTRPNDALAAMPALRPDEEPRAVEPADPADTTQRLTELPVPEPPATALVAPEDHPQPTRTRAEPATTFLPSPRLTLVPFRVPVETTPPAAPRRSGDGGLVPELLRGRLERERRLAEHGGSPHSQSAVKAALDWLAANQSPDGRWDSDQHGGGRETKTLGHDRGGAGAAADTGVSGLALLAFCGANYTHLDGPYRQTVQRGLEFLLRSQADDGSLAGRAELFARMYCHGMAALALSEAYALTGDQRLRPAVERAVQYTLRAQHPTDGGWRYQPGDPGDMSQFGWQFLALKSADLAGIPIPAQTRAGMIRFVNSCAAGPHRGLASYRPRHVPSRTMTAESLTCRLLLPVRVAPAARQEAVAYLLEELPDTGPINLYYWYYATLGLFQLQGQPWKTWNAALQTRLLETQENRGAQAGSWSPDTVWGGYGGRVYSTAMAALCLEVYYRYLPLYAGDL
jgi:hypothetical protein